MIPSPAESKRFVNDFQTKLRQRSAADPDRVFDDIGNLVTDPRTLRVAYRQVARARGAKTPGVDGLTCARIESEIGVDWFVKRVHDDLKAHRYTPSVCLEIVAHKNGKKRTLAVPTVRDRTVQRVLVLALVPILEPRLHIGSSAYIRGRGTRHALKELEGIAKDPRTASFVGFDAHGYYDNILLARLMRELRCHIRDRRVLSLIETIISSGKTGVPGSTTVGLPQGGPLSNLLANLYRHPLDICIAADPRVVGHVAYGDDVRVGVDGDAAVATAVLDDVARFAHDDLGLIFSPDKTGIVERGEPFDFLSHRLTWNDGEAEWLPSPDALARLENNLRAARESQVEHDNNNNNNKEETKLQTTKPIDRILSGFSNYYAQVVGRQKVEVLAREALDNHRQGR